MIHNVFDTVLSRSFVVHRKDIDMVLCGHVVEQRTTPPYDSGLLYLAARILVLLLVRLFGRMIPLGLQLSWEGTTRQSENHKKIWWKSLTISFFHLLEVVGHEWKRDFPLGWFTQLLFRFSFLELYRFRLKRKELFASSAESVLGQCKAEN